MQARMSNPATILPDATEAILTLLKATRKGGVPSATLELVHLRASQVNGCSFCVDSGARSAKQKGETDERLFALAAWREAPYFTDAERAALALTEAATRLADRADPVPDSIWDEATRHYDEKGLAAIILMIATTNLSTASTPPPGRQRAKRGKADPFLRSLHSADAGRPTTPGWAAQLLTRSPI